MARTVIKQGDMLPNVVANLKHQDGSAVDLSTASGVRFIMKSSTSSTPKVDASATISDAANGQVSYEWQSGDTDTEGTYQAEFEVDWGSSDYQTFPAEDYIEVVIVPDLGGSA